MVEDKKLANKPNPPLNTIEKVLRFVLTVNIVMQLVYKVSFT